MESATPLPRNSSQQRFWRSRHARVFMSSPGNVVGLILLFTFVVLALLPVRWLPHDPTLIAPAQRHLPPVGLGAKSGAFLLGTDHLGRDLLSRIVYSVRNTLAVMVCGVALAAGTGVIAGLLSGYYGGMLGSVINRLVDIQLAFPLILLAIIAMALLGPGFTNLVLVLGLFDWGRFTRVVRSSTLSVKARDYVVSAHAMGVSGPRMLIRHVLPNIVSPILVMSTFVAATILLTESALSFLGLGLAPPISTLGGMVGDGRNYLFEAWWSSGLPGIVLTLLVLAINFVGDGVRDAFDPEMTVDETRRKRRGASERG